MNKKLLTLAVAAALAAPGLASAEAIMYGKMNVSLDYESIDNWIQPFYNNTGAQDYNNGEYTIGGNPGTNLWVNYAGNGYNIARAQAADENVPAPFLADGTTPNPAWPGYVNGTAGTLRVGPGQAVPGQDFSGWGMNKGANLRGEGRASRFGIKGSEDLGNGLKAVYQIEIGVNFDTNNALTNNADTFYWRNTFAGLAGDWGTILMGRHDTPLKISTAKLDLFSDTMADYNGTIGFDDLRADNAVAYISPSWAGFQLAAAIVPSGMGTALGVSNVNSDQINGGYSLAGIYKNGPFYGSVAYESLNEEMYMSTAQSLNGCPSILNYTATATGWNLDSTGYACNKANSDYNKWRVGLGILDWNGFTLTGIYEQQSDLAASQPIAALNSYDTVLDPTGSQNSFYLPGAPDERELWQIQAGYAFGNFMVKGMYGQTTFSGDYRLPTWGGITPQNRGVYSAMAEDYYNGGTSSWAIGFDYNFSKRTQAYVLYTATTADGSSSPLLYGANTGASADIAAAVLSGNVANNRRYDWDGFSLGMMHSF